VWNLSQAQCEQALEALSPSAVEPMCETPVSKAGTR
jgi:hypothetical protein